MKIIDTHVHLGTSGFTGLENREEDLWQSMKKNGITASLVMPQATRGGNEAMHRRIAAMSRKSPRRIFGIVSQDPLVEEAAYHHEVAFCVEQDHFVAIKLNPMGYGVPINSPACNKVYEAATHYRIPVIIHTGLGNPHSLPSLMLDPARRYPEVTFVMAHAGFAVYTDEAIVTANHSDNILLEPSWCPGYTIRHMIEKVGIDRIIMGSDHITNIPVEIIKYKALGLNETELEKIFFINPNRCFQLDL